MDVTELLRQQAGEIASAGHMGWGNTMVFAADELDRLRAERDALRGALAGAVNVLDLLRTHAGAKYEYASSRAGTLVHVAPTIDAAAALLTPNAK